jgi:putative toxin-antitoxin system antitoxin component (TIGR02293 family)
MARCRIIIGIMPHTPAITVPVPAPATDSRSLWQRVRELLGLSDSVGAEETDMGAARVVAVGLEPEVLRRLREAGFTKQEIFQLVIPQRTLTHRKGKAVRLNRDESDRVLRVARIFMLTVQVFGNREKAWHWLRKPKWLFDDKAPLDLLDTEAGTRAVEEELIRIDEGMFI